MEPHALTNWLASHYSLPQPLTCELLRAYTNDVYEIKTGQDRFVLKVYGKDWRSEADIRYEIALLQHLDAKGVRVALPIAGHDQDFLRTIETEEDKRYAVLFEFADGEKPQPPFSVALYEEFGRTFAKMHTASDDFKTEHFRPARDLTYLIDDPLRVVLPHIAHSEDRDYLLNLAACVKDKIASFVLDWGVIHGDATLLHVTDSGGIVLYDFDSGGCGWRASDLQGWAIHHEEYQEKGMAFRRGYAEVRPLADMDIEAAPFLVAAWDIWGMQIELERRVLRQGSEFTTRYLSEQIAWFRERHRALLP